jgi:predicted aspartyl protease
LSNSHVQQLFRSQFYDLLIEALIDTGFERYTCLQQASWASGAPHSMNIASCL